MFWYFRQDETGGLRAKSTKTRIETTIHSIDYPNPNGFKSKIHQNKDWNPTVLWLRLTKCFRV